MPAFSLSSSHRYAMMYWLPALAAGGMALLAFLAFGATPPGRAAGLAASVVAIALALRRFGALLAFLGGLALAFSPAFWSQTGGSAGGALNLIILAVLIAGLGAVILGWLGKHPSLGLAAGMLIFVVLFWLLVGTPRSLRLTTFMSAWLLYLLIDALFTAHPRPDETPPAPLKPYHLGGILLLLTLGVLNDPLFILMSPAVILALALSKTPLARWYWGIIVVVLLVGVWGVTAQYLDSSWWLYPAAQAESLGLRVPFVMADGWRQASRWLEMVSLIAGQFTPLGILLGLIGLSRLSRWYPPLGVVTLVAYAAYALFGLVYFGKDSPVLLLPLLMIQVIWMTYAVYTVGQWLQKSLRLSGVAGRWAGVSKVMLR